MVVFTKNNGSRVAVNTAKVIIVEASGADGSCIYLATSNGYITVNVKESVYTVYQAMEGNQ